MRRRNEGQEQVPLTRRHMAATLSPWRGQDLIQARPAR